MKVYQETNCQNPWKCIRKQSVGTNESVSGDKVLELMKVSGDKVPEQMKVYQETKCQNWWKCIRKQNFRTDEYDSKEKVVYVDVWETNFWNYR